MNHLPTQSDLNSLRNKRKKGYIEASEGSGGSREVLAEYEKNELNEKRVEPTTSKYERNEIRVTISTELMETRQALNRRTAYCRAHAGDLHRQHYERGVKRAVRLLATEYMPLIRQLRKAVSDDELRAHVANLEARMEKGWGMEASEKRDDLFARLLVEYEVVMDALDDGTQSREMQRIEPVVA